MRNFDSADERNSSRRHRIDEQPNQTLCWTEIDRVPPATDDERAVGPRLHGRAWFSWLPVGATTEAIASESVGQSLHAGLTVSEAVWLAADTAVSQRMKLALEQMAVAVRAGARLEWALKKTDQRVSSGLLDALRIGQDRGDLATELRSFARRLRPDISQRLIRSVGRSSYAVQFASILARMLQDHRLSDSVVEDAGRLAAAGNKPFLATVGKVVESMQNGDSLSQAVHRHPTHFDHMFCRFVDCGSGRAAFCANLLLLAGEQ